ncbi:MAG: DUF983 domain-containing protein [Acidimicrobiales bacterium]|nr:DUF983 domain-containing protein [Acidimicrobiales bacterium]
MISTAVHTLPVRRPALLGRALRRRCPQCGGKGFFSSWFKLNDHCPTCGIASEREDGHFVGAVGFNTIFSFGALLITLLVGTWATYPHIPVVAMLAVCFGTAIVVHMLFWPFSQTLWMAFDLGWRPATEEELDPAYLARTVGV